FASGEPSDWFFGLVSHLSCLIYDAGEGTLDCLARFRFDQERQDIVGESVSTFVTDLRPLRTSFQHALSLNSSENQRTLHTVESWYRRRCGESAPRPDHYRGLVASMLIEWRAAVDNVHDVINNLHSAPSSLAVRNALGVARRHLPQGELLRLIG